MWTEAPSYLWRHSRVRIPLENIASEVSLQYLIIMQDSVFCWR